MPDRKLPVGRVHQLILVVLSVLTCVASCAPTDKNPSSANAKPAISSIKPKVSGPRQLSSIEPYLEERVKQLGLDSQQSKDLSREKSKARQLNSIEPLLEDRAKQLGLDGSRNGDSEGSSLTPSGSSSGSLSSVSSEQSSGRQLYYGGPTYGQHQQQHPIAYQPQPGYGAAPAAYSSAPGTYGTAPGAYGSGAPASAYGAAYSQPQEYSMPAAAPVSLYGATPAYAAGRPEDLPKIYEGNRLYLPPPSEAPSAYPNNHGVAVLPPVPEPGLPVLRPVLELTKPEIKIYSTSKTKHHQPGQPRKKVSAQKKIISFKEVKRHEEQFDAGEMLQPEFYIQEEAYPGLVEQGYKRKEPTTTSAPTPTTTSKPEPETSKPETTTEAPEPPTTEATPEARPTAKGITRAKPAKASEQEKLEPQKEGQQEAKQEPAKEDRTPNEDAKQEEEESPKQEEEERQPKQDEEEDEGEKKKGQKTPERDEQPQQEEQESPKQEEDQLKKSLFEDAGFSQIQALKDLFGGGSGGFGILGDQSEPESSSPPRAATADDGQDAAPSGGGQSEQAAGENNQPGSESAQQAPQADTASSESDQPEEDPEHHEEHDVSQVMGRQAQPPKGLWGDHEEGNPVEELEDRTDLLAAILKNSKEDREALAEANGKLESRGPAVADDESPDGAQQQQQPKVATESEMESQINSLRDALRAAIERASKTRKVKSPTSAKSSSDTVELRPGNGQAQGQGQGQGLSGLDFSLSLG